jgi:murein DD-endopeptidase MepM/ murein hydrolase activator NlpD
MTKFSFDISPQLRLDLCLIKKRRKEIIGETLLPSLDKLRRIRRGSKVSRFFRHIFEHQKIRKILGSNLIFVALASSFVPTVGASQNIEAEQPVIAVKETPLSTVRSVVYPVAQVRITQGYHFFHRAIDLDGVTGDPVNPVMAGVVIKIQNSRFALGNAIYIYHGNDYVSVYAHLSKIEVTKGQIVDTTTKIGEIGSTGRSFGDHLHLEIHQAGQAINPLTILPPLF